MPDRPGVIKQKRPLLLRGRFLATFRRQRALRASPPPVMNFLKRHPFACLLLAWLFFGLMMSRATREEPAKLGQLIEQLKADRLSAEQITATTAQALRAQADPATKWDHAWGEFVELARAKGKVPD